MGVLRNIDVQLLQLFENALASEFWFVQSGKDLELTNIFVEEGWCRAFLHPYYGRIEYYNTHAYYIIQEYDKILKQTPIPLSI
jgi:hypothetical protein